MKLLAAMFLAAVLPITAAAELSLSDQGRAFMEQNKTRSDIVTTKSGLQYKILEPGNDKRPGRGSRVTVHYQGKHINNEIFDSNFGGEPLTVRLRSVIKGWSEGLQHIGEGGRIMLIVPSNLGYGRDGAPPVIGRRETLVFIIDLIEVHS